MLPGELSKPARDALRLALSLVPGLLIVGLVGLVEVLNLPLPTPLPTVGAPVTLGAVLANRIWIDWLRCEGSCSGLSSKDQIILAEIGGWWHK